MVTTDDQVKHEDLEKLYIVLDKRETSFLSSLRRGPRLGNPELFSWTAGKFEDDRDNNLMPGIPETKDVDVFETDKQDRLYGRPQKFRRTVMVTDEANEISESPGNFGTFDQQKVKKTILQKRNIQKRLLSDADSRDDDGLTGREFMGAGRFVNDAISVGSAGVALTFGDAQTAIPAALRTPTAQIYTGNLDAVDASGNKTLIFTRDNFDAMLQSRWDAIGETGELVGWVDAKLKSHLTKMERYEQNMSGFTPTGRTPMNAISNKRYLMFGADVLDTDYGPLIINLASFMPRTSTGALSGRGYFFDMEHIALRPSGLWLRFTQLENKGAGPRGYLQSIVGPRWGHPAAHCKVDPNVATGTF